ncbi:MAG: DUF359 domain-containing protein [Methanocellales archaeon]
MTLLLPQELREKLKKPLGKLYSGANCMEKLKAELNMDMEREDERKIITVGDVVTHSAIKKGILPDIAIVDEKTLRARVSEEVIEDTKQFFLKTVRAPNPAGTLTPELIAAIKEALNSKYRVRIFIEGEEDLATLPAIALAPLSSVIIYGQPSEGIVAVKVTDSKKKLARALMEKMERVL